MAWGSRAMVPIWLLNTFCLMWPDKIVGVKTAAIFVLLLVVNCMKRNRSADQPKFALVSFSDRPELSSLTWPSLTRLSEAHPGRYFLSLTDENLVAGSHFHPSWNKLALIDRLLNHGHPELHYPFDAVIWIDDDIVITNVGRDALHDAMLKYLFCKHCTKTVLASRDPVQIPTEDDGYIQSGLWRVNVAFYLNAGLLVFKQNGIAREIVKELFKIGRHPQPMANGDIYDLRWEGQLENDAITIYLMRHGNSSWKTLEHGILQSFIKPGTSWWAPGHFSAHFMGFSEKVPFAKHFVNFLRLNNPDRVDHEAIFWVGCYVDDDERDFKAEPFKRTQSFGTMSCSEKCRGHPYMALQNGGECSCGTGYGREDRYAWLPDEDCSPKCVGEEDLIPARRCGGKFSNAVYYLWNGWTLYPNLGGKRTGMYWVGCFLDYLVFERLRREGPKRSGYTTVSCKDACLHWVTSYMFLEDGGVCSCGDLYMTQAHYSPVHDRHCGPVCKGEDSLSPIRYCGSRERAAVYFIGKSMNRFL